MLIPLKPLGGFGTLLLISVKLLSETTKMPLLVLNVTETSTPFNDTQPLKQVMMKNAESPGQLTQEKVIVYVGVWPDWFTSLFL